MNGVTRILICGNYPRCDAPLLQSICNQQYFTVAMNVIFRSTPGCHIYHSSLCLQQLFFKIIRGFGYIIRFPHQPYSTKENAQHTQNDARLSLMVQSFLKLLSRRGDNVAENNQTDTMT